MLRVSTPRCVLRILQSVQGSKRCCPPSGPTDVYRPQVQPGWSACTPFPDGLAVGALIPSSLLFQRSWTVPLGWL